MSDDTSRRGARGDGRIDTGPSARAPAAARFRLWARVERLGACDYRVVVAAVPAQPGRGPCAHDVRCAYASSPFVAELLRVALSQRVRDIVAARGDAIGALA